MPKVTTTIPLIVPSNIKIENVFLDISVILAFDTELTNKSICATNKNVDILENE